MAPTWGADALGAQGRGAKQTKRRRRRPTEAKPATQSGPQSCKKAKGGRVCLRGPIAAPITAHSALAFALVLATAAAATKETSPAARRRPLGRASGPKRSRPLRLRQTDRSAAPSDRRESRRSLGAMMATSDNVRLWVWRRSGCRCRRRRRVHWALYRVWAIVTVVCIAGCAALQRLASKRATVCSGRRSLGAAVAGEVAQVARRAHNGPKGPKFNATRNARVCVSRRATRNQRNRIEI